MATGTMPNEPTPPTVHAAGGGAVDYDGYIEAQLRKTRAQVKVVDIVTGVLVLITGALAYLFALALIDHWILPLGFALRILALLVLVGGAGWWFVVRILPLILHRINPVYAAYTIERAEPTLKNSLINFLLFRGRQAEMREVVYQALGQRAASDLRHVPVDQSVDRSMLIKIGYVLAAVLAVCALYKIISPKDPLQSVARVIVPWADIDRPSRVQIDDVRPGNDVSVFFGDTVTVSARVRGLGRGDDVKLIYSTADGQVIDQELEMKLDSAGLEHQCTLLPGEEGITQTLQYRIAAGDAETRWYNVEVVPAPTIIVRQVRYEFPRYTGRSEEVVEGTGDVSALEGTKVTLYAQANRDIESAYLEFDPIAGEESAHDRGGDAKTFKITKIDGDKAEVSFYLQLKPDRKTQVHSNYWLRFKSADGYRNRHPIVHAIDVKPDLAPLVEILTPTETRVEVPQNGRATVEVRAVDHDFAISKVAVRGIKGTEDLFDVALLESRDGRSGQVVEKFEFVPEKYGLVEGDVVEYWAVAEDNRTAVRTQRAEPNTSRSNPNFRFEIVPPKKDEPAERPEDKPRDDSQPSDDQQSSGQGGQPQDNDQQQGGGSGNEGQPQDKDQPQNNDQQSDQGGQSGNQGGTSGKQGKPSGQQGDSPDGRSGQDGGESGGQNSKPNDGQSPSSDSQGEGNGQPGQQGDQQSGADGQKTGQGQRTGKPSDSQDGQGQTGQGQSGQGGEGQEEPVANDGSQDGDAFERIRDHIRQSKDGQKQDGQKQDGQRQDGQQQDGQRQDGQQQSGGNQPQDDQSPKDGGQSDGQSPQDQAQGGPRQQGGNDSPKAGDQSGAQQDSGQGQGSKPGDQQGGDSGGDAQGKQPQGGKDGQGQDGGSSGQKPGDQPGKQPDGSQQGGGGQQDKDQQGKSGGDTDGQQQGGGNDGQKQQDGGQGDKQGGQPQGGQRPDGSKPDGKDGGQQQSGGQGQNDKPGAGKQGDGQGSPMSQAEDQQQQNKPKSGGSQGGKPQDGGKSPGNSKKDSDSQGGSGGDRKGGGEQGGGQSTPQQGQDSAGSSSSGQQGDGASQDPGGDQKGKQGGGDQIADSPTGRSGDQSGDGSRSGDPKSGERGEDPRDGQSQPGGSSGGRTPGDGSSPQGDQSDNSDGSRPGDKPGDGSGSGIPTGGGKPSDNKPTDFSFDEKEPGADKANVEYARQATDMVLDYLKNQKDPDRELLDKLGWNKDELADFISRWERMKQTAGRNDAEGNDARRRLDDTLRSLGLRPRTNNVRTDSPDDARLRGQRDTGHQSRPPKEYAEQFRAFSKFIKPNE